MASVARNTLRGARYFASNAITAGTSDLTVFGYNIEAAIVFGRSVTFHLQKEFANRPEFPAWYARWQTKLNVDPISRYFVTKRNYVLKEGPAQLARSVNIFIDASLTMQGELGAVVIRGSPWYRRSWRVLVEDLVRPVKQWLVRKQKARAERKVREEVISESRTRAVTVVHFEDSPVPNEPAIDLVRQYLDLLEQLVGETEARWP
jgi:hypothetical protein